VVFSQYKGVRAKNGGWEVTTPREMANGKFSMQSMKNICDARLRAQATALRTIQSVHIERHVHLMPISAMELVD